MGSRVHLHWSWLIGMTEWEVDDEYKVTNTLLNGDAVLTFYVAGTKKYKPRWRNECPPRSCYHPLPHQKMLFFWFLFFPFKEYSQASPIIPREVTVSPVNHQFLLVISNNVRHCVGVFVDKLLLWNSLWAVRQWRAAGGP